MINFLSGMCDHQKQGHSQKKLLTGNDHEKFLTKTTSIVKFSCKVIKEIMITINNNNEKND